MNQIIVFYNPFLPELKITLNGKKISPYSSLMSYQHQRLEKWSDCLFTELYREVNYDYEMLCVSNEFVCEWLGELARRNSHCLSFTSQPLPLGANVYERLGQLGLLGCEEENSFVIPIVNASGDCKMTSAVFEVLEEQGIFEDVADNEITWTDCPLTTVEIKAFGVDDDLPYDVPFVIALCGSEDDYIGIDADVPIYALVMGTETRFIRKKAGKYFFSVDPDDIGRMLLGILEEEALSPLLSHLNYNFPEYERAFLTEAEQEELELVCQASPLCRVTIPQICDVGRKVELNGKIFPKSCEISLHILSDVTDVIDCDGATLIPRSVGSAEITVFVGDDPYPVASEIVRVRQRNLISDIKLFPSALCMPVGGESKLSMTIVPEDAENIDEILWSCSDTFIASVDSITGVVTAISCGRCTLTAYTQEISKSAVLEVQPEIEDIICPCSFLELGVGEHKEWKYTVIPQNGYGSDTLRAVSSDKEIAEYRGGYILGKSTGECKIYIKNQSGSISRELKVTVRKSKKLW